MVEHVLPTLHALTAVPLGGLLKVMKQVLCGIGSAHVLPRAGHAPFEGHEKAPLCLVLQKHTDSCVPRQCLDSVGGELGWSEVWEKVGGCKGSYGGEYGVKKGWEKEGKRENTNPLR